MGGTSSRILSILRNSGKYVSGQDISQELGISRTAVWKNVNKLRNTGYTIEAVSNRGYRLLEGVDLPTADEVGRLTRASCMGHDIIYMKTVDSTNNLAMMLAAQGAGHGTLVTADTQTQGKGRRGRYWYSPPGKSLYMSLILRPRVSPSEASQIPVLSVIASTRALRRIAPELEFNIKWPNDIYCSGRKISGTLCEMKAEMDRVEFVVVGIGINVNTDPSDPDLPDSATSLLMETGFTYARSEVAARFLEEFELIFQQWQHDCNLGRYMSEWESTSMLLGRQVAVRTSTGLLRGEAAGIAENGALRLLTEEGYQRLVYAGDATLDDGSTPEPQGELF